MAMVVELDSGQHDAAMHTSDSLFVRSGAGSGKTEVISTRIAHFIRSGRWRSDQIVALTFTRAMAGDLQRRVVRALPKDLPCQACQGTGKMNGYVCGRCSGLMVSGVTPPAIGTLHGLAAGWVREALRGDLSGGRAILDLGWVTGPDFGIAMPEDVADMVTNAYVDLKRLKVKKRDLQAGLKKRGAELDGWPRDTEARRQMASRNLVGYDDLLVMLEAMLTADADGLPRLPETKPCLVIDEAQDLSRWHWRIVEAWDPKSITIVADDAQRIYGFLEKKNPAGLGDEYDFASAMARCSDGTALAMNYRSTYEIVELANGVRACLALDGACTDHDVAPWRSGDPKSVSVVTAEDWTGEVVAQVMDLLLSGMEPDEIVIIGRTWDDVESAADAVRSATDVDVRVPSRGRDRWSGIAGRTVVAIARSASRGTIDEIDAQTILTCLAHNDARRAVGRVLSQAVANATSLAAQLDADPETSHGLPAGWWQGCCGLDSLAALGEHVAAAAHLGGGSLSKMGAEAASWMPDGGDDIEGPVARPTPGDWLVWLASDESNARVELAEGAVAATTIHGAKGLEWGAVVLVGACEGMLPASWDRDEASLAEAGRALYVAITRAKRALRIIVPTIIRGKPRHPTRWLRAAGVAHDNPAVDAAADEMEQ